MSDRTYQLDFSSSSSLLLALVCVLLTIAPNTAGAQTPTLIVETIPPLEGIHFRLGDETFVTDERGVIVLIAPKTPSVYKLKVDEHLLIGDSQRAEFVAWSDGVVNAERTVDSRETSWLQAGFSIDYLVNEDFRNSNGDTLGSKSIDSFTIVDDTNDSTTFRGTSSGLAGPTALAWQRFPPGTRWMRAVRIVREGEALKAESASYNVRSVMVEGERATVFSDSFVPSEDADWTITLDASRNPVGQIVVAVVAILLVGSLFIMMRVRGGSKTAIARTPAPFLRFVRERIGRGQAPASVYVRVKLQNGRTVEGWKMMVPGAEDSEAINIKVEQVCGPNGEQLVPEPLDSFVLPSQIVDLEMQRDQPQVLG